MKKTILISVLLFTPLVSSAHPGRTDSSGCHTCRTNCSSWGLSTGEYHCHQSKGLPQPVEPIHSVYSDTGPGTTIPAPEYKEVKKPTVQSATKPIEQKAVVSTSTQIKKSTAAIATSTQNKEASTTRSTFSPTINPSKPIEVKNTDTGWFRKIINWIF